MARISIDMQGGTIKNTKKVIVGIDLGTTNSLIAVMEEGNAVALKADNSHSLLPSIVHIKENSDYVVGKDALRYLLDDPENTVFSVKRLLGKSYSDVENHQSLFPFTIIDEENDSLVKIKMRDRYLTPVEISAIILKELKKKAEEILTANVEQAVITVPAYFNDAQRQATRDAGKLAGLDVLRIINEPTAAALSYGLQTNADGETIAVYDLGGGTFDLSILNINDGIFEVLSTHGDTYLGGDDFDRAILDYWMGEYGISKEEINAYRVYAEEAKLVLSAEESYSKKIDNIHLQINRGTFERIADPLVQKTIAACDKAIKDAELDKKDITRVVMVGGSTRIPYVQRMVSEFFGKPVHNDLDPDEVVALGAAIQADILAGNRKDLLLLDITPLSLGIETVGGLMDVLIPRNTTVPSRLARNYTTSVDGQKNLKIAVYQGERDMIVDNRKLGEFILKDLPPMPAGIPKIEIQFLIDANGILKVKAKELRSEMEQEIDIKPSYGITEAEMGRMLMESIKYASMDMKKKALVEAQVEANNIVLSTSKFITQNEDWLEQEVKVELESLKAKLMAEIKEGSKDEINLAMENLTVYSKPFAHVALERNIATAIKGTKM